jgi:muramoyltetrapeptide carboxypeptidase
MPQDTFSASPAIQCRIIGCSNGLPNSRRPRIDRLTQYVESLGYSTQISDSLFVAGPTAAYSAAARTAALVDAIADPRVALILDVTGGDATSSMLRLIPDSIQGEGSGTRFVGLSDNTTIHCVLAHAAPALRRIYWYPTNLVLDDGSHARAIFENMLAGAAAPNLDLGWIAGEVLDGVLIGGNLRCLLKLAGTPYFPGLADAVLLLEGNSGGLLRTLVGIDQLFDMGALAEVSGVLLGEFGELTYDERRTVGEYIGELTGGRLTVCCTDLVGHGTCTVPVSLGEPLSVNRSGRQGG